MDLKGPNDMHVLPVWAASHFFRQQLTSRRKYYPLTTETTLPWQSKSTSRRLLRNPKHQTLWTSQPNRKSQHHTQHPTPSCLPKKKSRKQWLRFRLSLGGIYADDVLIGKQICCRISAANFTLKHQRVFANFFFAFWSCLSQHQKLSQIVSFGRVSIVYAGRNIVYFSLGFEI